MQNATNTCYTKPIADLDEKAASSFPNLVFAFMCITTIFPIFTDCFNSITKLENQKYSSEKIERFERHSNQKNLLKFKRSF